MSNFTDLPIFCDELYCWQLDFLKAYYSGKYNRFLMVIPRRHGKTKQALSRIIEQMLIREQAGHTGTLFSYLMPEHKQARETIWEGMDDDGVKFLDYFPNFLIKRRNNQLMRLYSRNSIFHLSGMNTFESKRGGNAFTIDFDEFSKMDPTALDVVMPMMTNKKRKLIFIYTPSGKNHAYNLHQSHVGDKNWFIMHLSCEETLKQDGSLVLPLEAREQMRKEMSHKMFMQELYCSYTVWDTGNIFAEYIEDLISKQRYITIPIDTTYPVETYWDLGINDATVILFVQRIRNEIRIIDFFETNDKSLIDIISFVYKWRETNRVVFGTHYAPHDVAVRDKVTGVTILDQLAHLNFYFRKVDRIKKKRFAFELAYSMFNKIYINKDNCAKLIEYMLSYEVDEGAPLKNRQNKNCTNAVDAFLQICQVWGFKEEQHQKQVMSIKVGTAPIFD